MKRIWAVWVTDCPEHGSHHVKTRRAKSALRVGGRMHGYSRREIIEDKIEFSVEEITPELQKLLSGITYID